MLGGTDQSRGKEGLTKKKGKKLKKGGGVGTKSEQEKENVSRAAHNVKTSATGKRATHKGEA